MLRRSNNLIWFFIGVLIIILLTVIYEKVSAEELTAHYNITLYTMSTDQQLTVAWDDTNPDIQETFEFYLWNHGEQRKYAIGQTQQLQVTTFIPRTGLYAFFARACDNVTTLPTSLTENEVTEYKCSEYASSVMEQPDGTPYGVVKDPATGQLTPGKWMIYGHVGAPTGGGVE